MSVPGSTSSDPSARQFHAFRFVPFKVQPEDPPRRQRLELAVKFIPQGRVLRFRRIVLPQVVRASLPGLVNEMSLLVKTTPVLAVVGVVEVTRAAVRIGAETYEPLPPFFVALAVYLPIVFVLVSTQRRLERRMARSTAP